MIAVNHLPIKTTPFNVFENIADPDKVALVRAVVSGTTKFANEILYICSYPSNFFILCTKMSFCIDIIIHSGLSLA